MATSIECQVCVESLNRSNRYPIECSKCEYVCCKVCFKAYITEDQHYFKCMNCNVEFDRSTLFDFLGRSFMQQTYRDIRQAQLYEREKSFFPATQNAIEKQLEIERLSGERERLTKKYDNIRTEKTAELLEFRYSQECTSVCEALDTYLTMKEYIEGIDKELQYERAALTDQIQNLHTNDASPVKRTYVLPCTRVDCKGMLSKETRNKVGHYLCSICSGVTCRDCQMPIEADDHEWDPDVLASVKLVEASSKPCPSCGALIQKISGCNQMFCTSCHASFDWRTLRLNSGAVHNPHHSEWLRTQKNRPRELGDLPCGRELDINLVVNVSGSFEDALRKARQYRTFQKEVDYLFEAMRVVIHHQHETIAVLNRSQFGQHTNQALRVSLLLKRVSEEAFKREIQKRDKANAKKNELLQVVITYRDALTDLVWPSCGPGEA